MPRSALALVAVCLFALPVQASVTLMSAAGSVQIQTPTSPTTSLTQTETRSDLGPFQKSLYNNTFLAGGTASAMASQVSSFSLAPGGDLAGASFAGTAADTVAIFSPLSSGVGASSVFSFYFEVAGSPVTYSLAGSLTPLGQPAGPSVTLWNATGPTMAMVASADSFTAATEPFSFGGTLQPGTYYLNAYVNYGYANTTTVTADAGSLQYTFAVTPEPLSLALLCLGGPAVLRRRR